MNRIVSRSLGFCLLTGVSLSAFAFNPVDGNYGGLFVGASYSPGSSFTLDQPTTFVGPNAIVSFQSGSISRSLMGNVGGELGYRFCTNYRVEIEAFYNNNHFKNLTLNNLYVASPYLTQPITGSVTFNNMENTSNPHIQGDTNTGAGMINAFYDFFIPNQDGYSNVVPYVGLGIGYGYVQNAMQFYRLQLSTTETNDSREIFEVWQTRSGLAGQAVGGLSYFMDDFTWFSLDVRYWATQPKNNPSSTYTVITPTTRYDIDSTVNIFGKNTQIMSINLTFNGVFNVA